MAGLEGRVRYVGVSAAAVPTPCVHAHACVVVRASVCIGGDTGIGHIVRQPVPLLLHALHACIGTCPCAMHAAVPAAGSARPIGVEKQTVMHADSACIG
jgi:hypothetical protein